MLLYKRIRNFPQQVKFIVWILTIFLCISGTHLPAQAPPSREYQLKAAFLFNFTQFVEWPPEILTSNGEPFVIGVLGENPFHSFLEELVSGEKVNGHPVSVRFYKNTADIKDCHILFISRATVQVKEQVIEPLKGRSILTVSDNQDFLYDGGMIRLFTKDNKIKMEVNAEASKAARLAISSKLLRLAEIFHSNEKKS